ncbi:hypothetical protein DUI87_03899 [Hirundo rustica rustica]|uniref:Secreted protein n=1 Tax=Hirundo rustica rustica TaxID=333673 RepID=A0A3M0L167_HIRRU|nr:hypothetical protein DUI87_03899 [Hirundo rustica rustica]
MSSLLLLATPFLIQARMPLALLATWAHCWLMSSCWHQCPQVPFLLGTVQPRLPQPVTLQGVIVAKGQDSALGLINLHLNVLCPSIIHSVIGFVLKGSLAFLDRIQRFAALSGNKFPAETVILDNGSVVTFLF